MKPRLHILLMAVFLLAMLLGFQNCTNLGGEPGTSERAALVGDQVSRNGVGGSQGNSDGYLGKATYYLYDEVGKCNQFGSNLESVIVLGADDLYRVYRENCLDLPAPRVIDDDSIAFLDNDILTLVYNNQAFSYFENENWVLEGTNDFVELVNECLTTTPGAPNAISVHRVYRDLVTQKYYASYNLSEVEVGPGISNRNRELVEVRVEVEIIVADFYADVIYVNDLGIEEYRRSNIKVDATWVTTGNLGTVVGVENYVVRSADGQVVNGPVALNCAN